MPIKQPEPKQLSNIELLTQIMDFGTGQSHGATVQMFIIDAIIKHAERCTSPEGQRALREGMKDNAFISPETWIQVATDVKRAMDRKYR